MQVRVNDKIHIKNRKDPLFSGQKGEKSKGYYISLTDCHAALLKCKNSLLQSARGCVVTPKAINPGHAWKRGKRLW